MKHPFAITQLTPEELSRAQGATRQEARLYSAVPVTQPFVTKPPFATTMAIGEEGGDMSLMDYS